MEKKRSLSVNIPAGIEDGTRIRLSGEGDAGIRGGPSGDLYIFFPLNHMNFFSEKEQIFTVVFLFQWLPLL